MRSQARVVGLDCGVALATVGGRGSVKGNTVVVATGEEEKKGWMVVGGTETENKWRDMD